jgi:hypothetical protein
MFFDHIKGELNRQTPKRVFARALGSSVAIATLPIGGDEIMITKVLGYNFRPVGANQFTVK